MLHLAYSSFPFHLDALSCFTVLTFWLKYSRYPSTVHQKRSQQQKALGRFCCKTEQQPQQRQCPHLLVEIRAVTEHPAPKVLGLFCRRHPEPDALSRRLIPRKLSQSVLAVIVSVAVWQQPCHVLVLQVLENCRRKTVAGNKRSCPPATLVYPCAAPSVRTCPHLLQPASPAALWRLTLCASQMRPHSLVPGGVHPPHHTHSLSRQS